MKVTPWITSIALLFVAGVGTAPAQADDWDHFHLTVSDTMAAAEWYNKYFGGEITKSGPFDAVLFGDKLMKFRKGGDDVQGTAGSAVDHVAFTFKDSKGKIEEFRAAGFEVKHSSRRNTEEGLLTDPWGTKIKILKDESTEGFHHVHLRSLTPLDTARWYAAAFDGEMTKFRGASHLPAIVFGDMMVVVQQSPSAVASTKNRSVDHLGWNFDDFDAIVKKLKEQGVTFLVDPQPSGDHMIAFIEGPDGVKIELVENK